MRLERSVYVAVGVLAVLGFFAQAASAQQQQGHVDMEGAVSDVPDELPGVYEAHIVAETSVQGGVCGCTHTNVELAVEEAAAADEAVLSPASWTIDWLRNTAEAPVHGSHFQDIVAKISVSEIPEGEKMVTVTIGGEATADSQWTDFEVNPLELALPAPDQVHQAEEASANASSSDGDADGDEADADAGSGSDVPAEAATTSATEATRASDADGHALEAGTGMAGLALAGLAVRRFRD